MEVDEVKVRFSLLEAQQRALAAENSRLQSQLAAVVDENSRKVSALEARNSKLEERLENQQQNLSSTVRGELRAVLGK